MFAGRSLAIVNALVLAADGSVHDTLRIRRGAVQALGGQPQSGDVVVDAGGDVVCPGLVNAHDHLELNSFARLKWRSRYGNVREWIADFQPRFAGDPALALARPGTLDDRVWVGGLKNLLSGVTTVCHHNPLHRPLRRRFPVRVVRRLGHSHSLQIDGERVQESYRRTPAAWPWIIHAAEGVDADAAGEFDRLDALRCLGANTVLVHGVALRNGHVVRALNHGVGLVWCPSSNEFLFGETADVRAFAAAGRVALGTDSRLSGEGDLLDELRAAGRTGQLTAEELFRTVTTDGAAILRQPDAGRLAAGKPADVIVVHRRTTDPVAAIVTASRADVRLSMIGGKPLYADRAMRAVFDTQRERPARVLVDGQERFLAGWIARRAGRMALGEPGLELRT
jgi:cytosine/adenosine deaminase-related metal-dependent hydrolase